MSLNGRTPSSLVRIAELLTEYREKVRALELTLEVLRGAEKYKRRPPSAAETPAEAAPPATPASKPQPSAEQRAANRQLSAELLKAFSPSAARSMADAGMKYEDHRRLAPLVRHGYLRKRGAGWVRTAKIFEP